MDAMKFEAVVSNAFSFGETQGVIKSKSLGGFVDRRVQVIVTDSKEDLSSLELRYKAALKLISERGCAYETQVTKGVDVCFSEGSDVKQYCPSCIAKRALLQSQEVSHGRD